MNAPTALEAPYRPRHIRFVRREEVAGWQLKLYGIALNGKEPEPAFVEATRDLAATVLPQPAGGRRPLRRRLRHGPRRDVALHRARLLVPVGERDSPAHPRQPEGRADRVRPGREPAGRLRLGARDRRLRAARVDRGRAREPGRAGSRALSRAAGSTRTSSAPAAGVCAARYWAKRPALVSSQALNSRSKSSVAARRTRPAGTSGRTAPGSADGSVCTVQLGEHHRRRRARTPIFFLTPSCSISLSFRFPSKGKTEQTPEFFPVRGRRHGGAPS